MAYKYELEDRLDAQLWNYNSLKEKATYKVYINSRIGFKRRYGVARFTKSTQLHGSAFDTPLQAYQYIKEQKAKDIAEGKVL